eukprot:CAMPEP_0116106244 /NCGR_PEP_ID=MMETSP0327-20121206/15530_1 /TAXON_ID=44447 /ORGANISM="Pseudo-nitzschia delicatissima, Strain B596" /LENGTH=244 /DNA_ID=CAMNT_0003598839 /DNA_START=57 /DNA_END=791 /DNA_ORIENTATION=+
MENSNEIDEPGPIVISPEKIVEDLEAEGEKAEGEKAEVEKAEGELNNISLDDETGLYTKEEDSQDIPKTRSWGKGWLKKKEATEDDAEAVEAAPKTKKVVKPSDLPTECNNFGSGLLNFCSFGLLSSHDTVVITEEVVEEHEEISPEKIVEDLVTSEAQLTMIDEETAMSSPSFNPRGKSIMSVHSGVQSEADDDSTTVASMMSQILKKRNSNTVVLKAVGVVIFLIMCALFITGGILLKRNGW